MKEPFSNVLSSSRRIEFDILKGIGILLVMLGHAHMFYGACVLPEGMNRVIGSFHVPLFFIVAGFFSKPFDSNWRKTISKYFRRLVVPFLITAAVILTYNAVLSIKRHTPELFLGITGSYLIGDPSKTLSSRLGFPDDMGVGPVWFLLALFWAKTLFLFISKTERFTCLICVLVSWVFSFIRIPLPWGIGQGVSALGFVAIGYWCSRHKLPVWLAITSFVCWLVSLIKGYGMDPYMACYPIYPLNLLSASGGTLFAFLISIGIAQIPFVRNVFSSVGNNSMNVLCVHTIDMRCNAVRVILKHIPFIAAYPIVSLMIDYVITLLLSFIPRIKADRTIYETK